MDEMINILLCIGEDDSFPRRHIIKGLRLIADSLTHLTLLYFSSIQLRDILELCPNLVSLNADDLDVVTPSSPSLRYPKMTHLGLLSSLSERALDHEDMVDLISRFPSLLSLEIGPMPDSKLLTILHEHCTHLQRLHYGGGYLSTGKFDVHPNPKGITSAHFFGGVSYHQDDLIQFLHLNQHSLETITLVGHINGDNGRWKLQHDKVVSNGAVGLLPENDPTQSKASFTQLTSIDFFPYSDTRDDIMKWMIWNAPNLKAISIPESHLQIDMAKAMTRSQHLSKLTINRMIGHHDFGGISEFLKFHIAKEGLSTLEEMTLNMNRPIHHVTWLPLISRLKCLKTLELLSPDILEGAKLTLVAIGLGCPALESLTLGNTGVKLGDGLIKPLCKLPNLKCLRIGARILSQPDLLALIEFPKLERLYLYYDVPDCIKEMLHNYIPKVIIV